MGKNKREREMSASSASTANVAVLLFTLVSSFLFGTWLNPPAPFTKMDLLRGLESVAAAGASDEQKHIAVGFNTNLDSVVANGPAFLRQLEGVDEFAPPLDVKVIQSPKEFGQVFAYHFSSASAGERTIANETLWNQILEQLESGFHDDIKLGGNAALMAEAVGKGYSNVDISLIGMTGVKIAGRLQSKIKIVGGKERTVTIGDKQYPALNDQIHLILEYPANAKFGPYKAQRANRFIVSCDFSNGVLAAIEPLDQLRSEKVDALVVAGIHLMEGVLAKNERSIRLQETKTMLENFPPTRIHLELGSTADENYAKEIVTNVPFESLGLNEQEFFSVCQSLGICKDEDKSSMTSATPPVVKVQASIAAFFDALPKLNRLHFHCFSYHIIAERSSASNRWQKSRNAVAAGAVIATTRACISRVSELHGNKLTLTISSIKVMNNDESTRSIDFSPSEPVAKFTYKNIDFHLAPVIACSIPKQTVGLGDYISASSLATQL